MTEEGRQRIQESNRTRHLKCAKCGSTATEMVDGERIGGLPGLQYRYCPACGWSTTKKPRRQPT